ncbi:DUF5680 domain-containing protein [Lactococcus hodotermopsidis]|nr:DUF5680 domain-containing protein [Lactococcus hodotermopsidis]
MNEYIMTVTGEFDWFSGNEKIFYKTELIYELLFHGGLIVDKHFD